VLVAVPITRYGAGALRDGVRAAEKASTPVKTAIVDSPDMRNFHGILPNGGPGQREKLIRKSLIDIMGKHGCRSRDISARVGFLHLVPPPTGRSSIKIA
jgi:hypothetical protein